MRGGTMSEIFMFCHDHSLAIINDIVVEFWAFIDHKEFFVCSDIIELSG